MNGRLEGRGKEGARKREKREQIASRLMTSSRRLFSTQTMPTQDETSIIIDETSIIHQVSTRTDAHLQYEFSRVYAHEDK